MEIKEAKTTNQSNKKKKRIQENKYYVRSLWDNFKRSNILIIGVPGEEKEKEIGHLFLKIMKENFPNLVKEIDMQVQ